MQFGRCRCHCKDGEPGTGVRFEKAVQAFWLPPSVGGWKSGSREPGGQRPGAWGLRVPAGLTSTPFPCLLALSDQQIQAPAVSENQEPVDGRDGS